ncbi:DUF5134 domain-containing protein [Nocardioides sp. YIM 152588]|uniref:DUF5134 domain-containing protein n=1 Tax=Nocardioides sp. YIM 152588 TaxID=3158259 RepID=UPI0032E3FF9D
MPGPLAVALTLCLTVCFAWCGGVAAVRLRGARGPCSRRRYAAHVAMAATMLAMVWVTLPAVPAIALAALFGALAAWFVVEAGREERPVPRLASAHHALMAGVMALMLVAMAAGHGAGDGHSGHGAALGPAAQAVLLGALLLAPAAVAWWQSRHRDRWLEGVASMSMALGAAAMTVLHV